MARKKKHAEHVNHERWMVSWADFMTLLFALFTALYAISTADQSKANSLAESTRAAFSLDMGKQATQMKKASSGAPTAKPAPRKSQSADDGALEPAQTKSIREESDPLASARKALEEALPKLKMHANIQLKTTKTSIVVTLRDKAFFKKGSAKLLPGVLPVLDKIAEVLLRADLAIRVEGHTDDQPSSSKVYTSNWDLSAARAVSVVRYFAEEYSYPPADLAVAGYASGRPIAGNDTEEGRMSNRRVDIILLAKSGRPKSRDRADMMGPPNPRAELPAAPAKSAEAPTPAAASIAVPPPATEKAAKPEG